MHLSSVFKFLPVFAAVLLSACGSTAVDMRSITADRIAMPAFMTERMIPAGQFTLNARERMHQRGAPATVYIEGDGVTWGTDVGGKDVPPISAPTPTNPVALHLASRDHAQNLVYLARPCQYLLHPDDESCTSEYWGDSRFSREVIDSYMIALDEIKARYDITGFHLVGYDGGAAIASILASHRGDTLSLRTVAGNLNPDVMADLHASAPLTGSLNPAAHAPMLSDVPQHHFIGAVDQVVPAAVYHSFRQAMGDSNCIHYSVVQDADHERGWVEKWPSLLDLPVECAIIHEPTTELPPSPHNTGYGKGLTK